MNVSEKQLELMQHALGFPKCYRNHYVTDSAGEDGRLWEDMVASGFAVVRKGSELTGGYSSYHVTNAGKSILEVPGGKTFVCSTCGRKRSLTAKVAKLLGWNVWVGGATCPSCLNPPL